MGDRSTLTERLSSAWRRGAEISDRMDSPARAQQVALAIASRWGRSL